RTTLPLRTRVGPAWVVRLPVLSSLVRVVRLYAAGLASPGCGASMSATSAHFYRRARAGIARHACFALANLERSEATDLDVLLLFQRVLDCIKECIHDAGAILLGNHGAGGAGDLRRHALDKVGFGHSIASGHAFAGRRT